VLLLRISSGGLKIKAEGTVAASIAESLGVVNIAKETPSLLQELSLEAVLAADPDVILVSVLGLEEDEAAQALEREFNAQTMWKSLRAVQAGDCHILSKALFHYKPNQRWGESYETFADLVWS
jgi:iron complex transport system substrate-binding protein